MRLLILALLIASFPGAPQGAKDDDNAVRGLYIGSRPKKSKPAPPRPPNPGSAVARPATKAPPSDPVGIGFSLYRVFDKSHAVRADASATFREHEMLRFVLEPSIDGYLYVFVSTDAGTPVMIYPDYRLERGDNFVYAHTVAEVPSRRNPSFDVFEIVGGPATENVTFVVSRVPLESVPIGDELLRYCEGGGACPWSPTAQAWDAIASRTPSGTRVSTKRDAGTAISRVEEGALTRELKLGSSDPEPSVVAVNASTDAPVLIHQVSIRHQ
jgi:hypothetical protein